MNWFRLTKLAFGAPLADNQPVLFEAPDVIDEARDKRPRRPGMGVAPSPFQGSKPGGPKKRRRPRRRPRSRRGPRPDLSEQPKTPTDSSTTRPTGDLLN
jgi:hypothetical protein